jgi:RNA polymerase sigma-70 factor (ECF subfamily)
MGTQTKFISRLAPTVKADFEAIYNEELPRVYNFFRYRVGDDQLAEDLTAETFEKAWRNREKYRNDLASFSTWLFTLARRIGTDHYRRQKPTVSLETAAHVRDPQIVEDVAERRADFKHLSLLLSRLAERERELVALKYGAGLTNRAITRITGLSESNVSTILHRVTQQLRAQWEQEL